MMPYQEEHSANPPAASQKTQLLEACAANHAEDVLRLLAAKANPNEVDSSGIAILLGATSDGFSEVAATLVEHGADVNASDKNQETALHHAAFNSMPDLAALLVDKGADLNARRFNGSTPLDCSAGHTVKRVLEERGAQTSAELKFRDKCRQEWKGVRQQRQAVAHAALHHQTQSDWMPLDPIVDPIAHLWSQHRPPEVPTAADCCPETLHARQVLGWSALGAVAGHLSPRKMVTSPRKDPARGLERARSTAL